MQPEEARWKRRIERERRAREAAEELLRRKSSELYEANAAMSRAFEETRTLQSRMNLALAGSGERLWEWSAASDLFTFTELVDIDHHEVHSESGLQLRARLHPADMLTYAYEWNALLFGMSEQLDTQFRVHDQDGSWKWVRQIGRAVERDESRLAQRIAGTEKDISRFREEKRDLRLFANAFDNASEGMCILTGDQRVLHANRMFEKLFRVDAGAAVGRRIEALAEHIVGAEQLEQAMGALDADGGWRGEFDWQDQKSGESRTVSVRMTAMAEQGASTYYVMVVSDMTERRKFEDQLIRLAHFDPLTGLANRAHFAERLNAAVAGCERGDAGVAVLFMDLDRFKQINDSLGHAAGDALLKTIAARLKGAVRSSDLAARWGGDEFVIMVTRLHDGTDAIRVANKIRESVLRVANIADQRLSVTGSLGVAVWPDDGKTAEQLIRHADSAMYQAKSRGRNCIHVYNPDIGENARRALALERSLRDALELGEFHIAWQPRVNLESGRISGAEALLRWTSGTLGSIGPGQFIPVAEETGLIVPIGRWILDRAVDQLRTWSDQGLSGMRVSVNVSPKQLQDSDLVADVETALKRSGIDAAMLELELTESCLVDDVTSTIRTLSRLRELGVGVAVDDFGTGYSSLSYLMNLPLSVLKIDRQFVTQIGADPRGEAIVETILALARNLGMRVVAEGVESEAQLRYLSTRGCSEVQGFLLFRPLPVDELDRRLADPRLRPEAPERDGGRSGTLPYIGAMTAESLQ